MLFIYLKDYKFHNLLWSDIDKLFFELFFLTQNSEDENKTIKYRDFLLSRSFLIEIQTKYWHNEREIWSSIKYEIPSFNCSSWE